MKNNMLVSFILMLGIFLSVLSWGVDNRLKDKACVSTKLKSANQGVMVIGLIFIVSSISFFICISKCNCSQSGNVNESNVFKGYILFCLVVSIILIVLGSIISSEAKEECADASKYASGIWIVGVLMFIVFGGITGLKGYSMYKSKNMEIMSNRGFLPRSSF